MNANLKFTLSALALLLTVSACSLFPDRPAPPALHDFGLSEKATSLQAGCSAANSGSTASVTAPEWLQTENIRYRLLYADPTQVRYYTQDRWLASPPAMLAQRLALACGKNGWRLKISWLAFEQVFDAPHSAKVILVFRATAQRPASEEIVAEKLFSLSQPASTADAKGAVAASEQLVGEAVNALQTWVTELSDLATGARSGTN
jgi:cholesterol transport system auxiliary component